MTEIGVRADLLRIRIVRNANPSLNTEQRGSAWFSSVTYKKVILEQAHIGPPQLPSTFRNIFIC